jgi:hypothetical protein
MTVEPRPEGGAVVNPDDYADIGLEDVGVSDVVIPRLQIIHDEALLKNNLSGETFDKLNVILLGLVKQRVMWADEVGESGSRPLCKSPDFENGFPNVRDDVPKDRRFDWSQSNFSPEDFPADKGLNGMVTLPCAQCVFKEWDKQGWKQPPCAEQHTYPLLYTTDEGESWAPALFTTQKTGIKPSRQYISSFAQTKTPMFTVYTELSLVLQSRGTVKYSTPSFKRRGQTERENWTEYGNQYRSIREFIRQAPRRQDDEEEPAASSNENTAPETAPASSPAPTPAPAAATSAPAAAPAGDDDLPF